MRIRTLMVAVAAMLMLSGCGNGGNGNGTASPTATEQIASEDMINIDGLLSISQNGDEYRIECKSNIPHGAFVTAYIMDESENVLISISDLKQKVSASDEEVVAKQQGKVVATVKVANLEKSIELNGSTQLFAVIEFFPGASVQPDSVKEICGSNGKLLTGNNVHKDDLANQQYIEMKSDPLVIMQSE